MVKRFDVYFVNLDPTVGKEIKKTRPCLIVSPDSMNKVLATVIIAPITSTIRGYPTRIKSFIDGRNGEIMLDQIRTIDKERLVKKLPASIKKDIEEEVCRTLCEMFEK